MDSYKVIRFYFNRSGYRKTIKTGLTLEQAQEHCENPETSSSTCTLASHVQRTKLYGPWFEGYEKE